MRAQLASGLGSGGTLHGASGQIIDASNRAFVYALQYGLRLSGTVALIGAMLAWVLVARREPTRGDLPGSDPLPAEHTAREPVTPRETIHV